MSLNINIYTTYVRTDDNKIPNLFHSRDICMRHILILFGVADWLLLIGISFDSIIFIFLLACFSLIWLLYHTDSYKLHIFILFFVIFAFELEKHRFRIAEFMEIRIIPNINIRTLDIYFWLNFIFVADLWFDYIYSISIILFFRIIHAQSIIEQCIRLPLYFFFRNFVYIGVISSIRLICLRIKIEMLISINLQK